MYRLLLAALLMANATFAQGASPPVILAAIPDHGDIDVDPNTTEIRITFSQDMNPGGRSICGGGPTFPTFSGTPRWDNPRTLIIPVKLEPDHAYDLSINCPAAMNFRNAAGESAEVTPISFRTGKANAGPPPAPPTAQDNQQAVATLRARIDQRYSYRDRVVKDWDAAFDAHRTELVAAQSRAAFAREAGRMLAAAQDLHMSLGVGEARFPTHRYVGTRNINPALIPKVVPKLTVHNRYVSSGRFDDGEGYISISGFPSDGKLLEPAHAALDSMKDAPGILVDVRSNGGGDEATARVFATRFVKETAVYSRSRIRDPGQPEGWAGPIDRSVPGSGNRAYSGKVAVLIGDGCMSSCESFILMMRHGAKAWLVGSRSHGSSGNPRPHSLGNGVTIYLPSWEDLEPDGTVLEGRGIKPDAEIAFIGKDRDEVILGALITLLPHPEPSVD